MSDTKPYLNLHGATFPHLEVEGSDPVLRDDLLGKLHQMGVRDLRIKYFKAWDNSDVFANLLQAVRTHGFTASIILSICEKDNVLIQGYPILPQLSIEQITTDLLPKLDQFFPDTVWGFDIRAEPFRHVQLEGTITEPPTDESGHVIENPENVCFFKNEEELDWLQQVADAIHGYQRLNPDRPSYKVYVNLLREALKPEYNFISQVAPFSDFIAINYYYPRHDEWDTELTEGRRGNPRLILDDHKVDADVLQMPDFMPAHFTYFLNELKKQAGNLPIIIAQCGEHQNEWPVTDPPITKPWVDDAGCEVWYDTFFDVLKSNGIHGVYFYDGGAKPDSFAVFDLDVSVPEVNRTSCCDAIEAFYTRKDPRG